MKRAAIALVFVASGALALPSPRMPGPSSATYTRGAREAEDAACVKCHAGVAREHQASLHRGAFDDEGFQRGYRIEPQAFCRSCHAPEARPDAEPDAFARTHGVTCVTCHVPETGGAVLASASAGGASAKPAPHPIARVEDFGTRACARCHEFAFPGSEALGDKGRMQRTMAEHAASDARERTCASCHMKSGHRFAASRDAELLARSVVVEAKRAPGTDGEATFTLRAEGVGHAMPTGDLFRRVVLRVRGSRGVVERPFGRTFRAMRDDAGHVVRFESSDTRLAPGRRVAIALPPGGATWEVVYQRVTSVGQVPPYASEVDAETVLARGAL